MDSEKAFEEQRSEDRIAGSFRLFVHVQGCDEHPDLVGKSIACEAMDISKQGIQISADIGVPAGTVLNVAIAIGKPFAMYLLEGEVRWQQTVNAGNRMGVMLLDKHETDYQKWSDSFDSTVAWIEYLEVSDI